MVAKDRRYSELTSLQITSEVDDSITDTEEVATPAKGQERRVTLMAKMKGKFQSAFAGQRKNVPKKSVVKRAKPSEQLNLEYFEPINRAAEKLKSGDGVSSTIYKKVTGTKDKVVGAFEDEFGQFGRRQFYGSVLKQRGNLAGDMHQRWTVVRGWSLYWYRMKDNIESVNKQKGILLLPNVDIDANPRQQALPILASKKDKKKLVGFHLPKGTSKDGQAKEGSRGMNFGDDVSTRIFRNILSYLIRYKIYAEQSQKEGKLMDPQVERYFKLDDKIIRQQYRHQIAIRNSDFKPVA